MNTEKRNTQNAKNRQSKDNLREITCDCVHASVREVALSILGKIEAAGQYSNIALDAGIHRYGFEGADRALLTALTYGVVEKKITLDYCIDSLSSIPPSKIEHDTRNILRMGLYQLCFLDRIPDRAAINESVNLCHKRSKGFVNALLRTFARGGKELPCPPKERGTVRYLSVKYSFTKELCSKFCEVFGEERTESLFRAFNRTPEITLRVNTLKTEREKLLELLKNAGIVAEKTEYSDCGIRLGTHEAFSDIPGADEGLWFIQDEASQLCATVLGAKAGNTVIDVCACPGGKSFSAAMSMNNEGRVLAFDLHENKLPLIESGAGNLGITIIETDARDGRNFDETLEGKADCVLCDVPCSGFGVFAKKPDIRYKKLSDTEKLPEIQLTITENCCRYVKDGGVLVYSTCTLLPAENEENVRKFLALHKEFQAENFSFGDLTSKDGMLTLMPDTDSMDGFFMAKMRKKSNK